MFMKIWARCLGELRATQAEAAGKDLNEYMNNGGAIKDSTDAMAILQSWKKLDGDITMGELKKMVPDQDDVFWSSFRLAYYIIEDLEPVLDKALSNQPQPEKAQA